LVDDFSLADHLDRLPRQGDIEIRHADPARQAQALGLGQRVHGFRQGDAAARRRPVDQGQIDVVGAQPGQAVAQAGGQLVAAGVLDPDLGGEEEVGARDAAFRDGLADFGFIAIDLRGVDGAVADVQRGAHGIDDGLAGEAEGADAEDGDVH
jgi:hypothetical protein